MYIAVKGGEEAIDASRELLARYRRGDTGVAALSVAQIRQQLALLVSRVMAEASVIDPELAALAIKQACGDSIEAAFLLRAYRTTLPRIGNTCPLNTDRMRVRRRVSAIFKDLPGGQVLGPTFDYTQRLLDFSLLEQDEPPCQSERSTHSSRHGALDTDAERSIDDFGLCPDALATLQAQGLVEPVAPDPDDPPPPDITRHPPRFPMNRSARLQMMARADEGWLLGMGYSTQRGYAHTHPFGGEIRHGAVPVSIVPDELGFEIMIGEIELTECKMINQFTGGAGQPPTFTRGYGLVAGHNERKAMAMSLVDRAMRHEEFDEPANAPVQDQEFALAHGDSVEASGFVQHLKLPHYVTFESELHLIRRLRAEHAGQAEDPAHAPSTGTGTDPSDTRHATMATEFDDER
ncbi:MAG: carbon-phosphorus lyase complex subunit PhnI [Burkholderiaceae bacterium]